MELSKLFSRLKVADIRRYNMERIDQAIKNGTNLKAAKQDLGTDKNQMCALRNKEGSVITNMNRIVEMSEEFYRELYRSQKKNFNGPGKLRECA